MIDDIFFNDFMHLVKELFFDPIFFCFEMKFFEDDSFYSSILDCFLSDSYN